MARRQLYSGKQWTVTRATLYTRRPGGFYVIERERIAETCDYGGGAILNWPMHMFMKVWLDRTDFEAAFRRALAEWAPKVPASLIDESFRQARERHGRD